MTDLDYKAHLDYRVRPHGELQPERWMSFVAQGNEMVACRAGFPSKEAAEAWGKLFIEKHGL